MGYMKKYLEVDLANNKITEHPLDMALAEKFIGGKGLGAKILFDNLKPKTNPLGEDNILLFMTGPLSGTKVQTSGRWCIVTKSPHTGIFLDSQVGGKFGYRLKKAGYDYIIVRGRADQPSYLYVSDNGIEIKDARNLWGKGTYETETILKKLHPESEVCSIGPAGENLVSFANIMTDRTHMAGRGGAGAVMGSKNLKAVVVSGSQKIEADDPEKFSRLTKAFRDKVRENPGVKRRHEIGTVMWVKMSNDGGFLPTRNFQSGVFKDANAISGETMLEKYVVGHTACYNCLIACGKTTKFTEGKYAGLEVDGPEYETSALIGASCGINDLGAIAKSNEICDDLGLDTITAGGTVAFAMECSEKGLLTQSEIENLKFGNADAQHKLLKLIAEKKGIGRLFANGSLAAAQQIGHNSSDFAIQVKRLELAGVEPRGSWGMALAYSTSDRGGCHQRCWTPGAELDGRLPRLSFEKVPEFVVDSQNERSVCFSLVLCDFLPFDVPEMVEMLNTATGFSYTVESYLLTGERIWNQVRLFNVNEGLTRDDDVLPARFYQEKMPEGFAKGHAIPKNEFENAVSRYYNLRGWTTDGIPTQEKLAQLDL